MRSKIAALALVLAAPVFGQEHKPVIDKAEWALLAADAGTRALDCYSTRQMIENGNREVILPRAVVNSTPAMAAFSGGMVVAHALFARYLIRSRHPKMAHIVTAIDIGADLPWAIHNLYLPDNREAR